MKKLFVYLMPVFFLLASCGTKNHHHKGASYIQNPSLNLFGARLEKNASGYVIKSYFKSSISGRTEYIYENLDISFPISFQTGKKYPLNHDQVKVWYAKGGQSGQLETKQAKGYFELLKITDEKIILKIEASFNEFEKQGNIAQAPQEITRKGLLTAKKNYSLY